VKPGRDGRAGVGTSRGEVVVADAIKGGTGVRRKGSTESQAADQQEGEARCFIAGKVRSEGPGRKLGQFDGNRAKGSAFLLRGWKRLFMLGERPLVSTGRRLAGRPTVVLCCACGAWRRLLSSCRYPTPRPRMPTTTSGPPKMEWNGAVGRTWLAQRL